MNGVTFFVSVISTAKALQDSHIAKIREEESVKELRHKILGYNLELYAKYVFKYGEDWAKKHANMTIEEIEREEKSLFYFLNDLL